MKNKQLKTVTGKFAGLADPHTFEMTTDETEEGYMVFQFQDEEMLAVLENMQPDQEITVTYQTNEYGQNVAESIK